MPSKFICLLWVGTLLLLVPGCEALFNRDSNKKNHIAVHDGGKNAQSDDDRMQAINDAATGTVKQTSPGNERAPNTCNEMMARAVVLANEERALAYDERDDALETAQRAYTDLGEISIKLSDANKKVTQVENELAALQESTDQATKIAKNEAQLEIDTNRNNTLLEMETLKNNTALQITMYQNEKKTAIKAAETQAADEIAAYKELRDAEVAAIQQEAKEQMENAAKTVLDNQSATELEIQQIQEQAKEQVDAANAHAKEVELEADATMKQVREKASERVHAAGVSANNHVEQFKADSSRQIIVMQETLAKAEAAANAAVQEANELAKESIDNMMAAMEKERAELKAEQIQLHETSAATIKQIQESSDAEIKAAKEAADEQVAQMKKKAEEQASASEQAATAKVAAIQKELEDSQAESERLVANVEKLKTEGYSYADQVSHFTDELAHWKQLHQSQPYCNMTLMKVESFRALEKAATVVSQEAKNVFDKTSITTSQQFDRTALLVRETSQPHLKTLEKTLEPHFQSFRKAYEESPVKEIVDKQAYPIYLKTAVPAFEATNKCMHEAWQKMQTLTRQGCDWTVRKGVQVAAWELKTIDNNPQLKTWTPEIVVQFLNYIKDNMEEWLLLKLKVIAVICAFFFRRSLLKLITASIKFPFQVLWFFCPLRFCIGGKKQVLKEEAIKKEVAATPSKEDATKNGVEPKKEKDTTGNGDHSITQ